jgi:hypothetical protein
MVSQKWCHPNIGVNVHKNARFKSQPSTPMLAFASIRSTPFMKINDKGGEIGQRYVWGRDCFGKDREIDDIRHGHGQRGSNIEEYKGIKILGQKKHTSRGSKLMNFD